MFFFEQDDVNVSRVIRELTPEPGIIVRGRLEEPTEIMITAENQPICKINAGSKGLTIVDAYVLFMAVCYVFMFHYPPPVKNLCLYLQKCILQIRDNKKLPINVIKFVNDVDRFASQGQV